MIKKLSAIALCLGFSATAFASEVETDPYYADEQLTVGIAEPSRVQQTSRVDTSEDGDPMGISVYDATQFDSIPPARQADQFTIAH